MNSCVRLAFKNGENSYKTDLPSFQLTKRFYDDLNVHIVFCLCFCVWHFYKPTPDKDKRNPFSVMSSENVAHQYSWKIIIFVFLKETKLMSSAICKNNNNNSVLCVEVRARFLFVLFSFLLAV